MWQRSLIAGLSLTLFLAGAGLGQNAAPPPPPAAAGNAHGDLPVSDVVLYTSGVGYFEHDGAVTGNADLPLTFKTQQINDILKSMVLMDLDGGSIAGVTYPTNQPLEHTLRSFGIDLSGQPTLPALLAQLRGVEVVVHAPNPIKGRILAVEEQVRVIGDPPAQITEHVLDLVTADGVRAIPLSSISHVELADEKLQQELNQALLLLANSHDTGRKPVLLQFHGQGKRRVRVGYILEAPIWKSSYRLDLSKLAAPAGPAAGEQKPAAGKEGKGQAADKAFLQGWAIVENASDSDWRKVTLSLVSGRPISFTQDLYTPLYVPRPEVKPELYTSLRPQVYEEGALAEETPQAVTELQARADLSRARRMEKSVAMEGMAAPAPAMAKRAGVALDQGIAAQASTAALGELFQYTIDHPVDLARGTSAMLPIINQDIPAEKVSIYNANVQAKHPLNGVYLSNETGMKLMGGPVTVFDGGAYAGDAQIAFLAPNEKRLLSYAIDLAVLIDPTQSSSSQITAIRIVRGVLQITVMLHFEQTYKIENNAPSAKTLVIEHPRDPQRQLLQPKAAFEETPQLLRFRVPVAAAGTSKFAVIEQQPQLSTISILGQDVGAILHYANSKEAPEAVRQALQKAAELKNQLSALQQQLEQKQQQLNEILQDQPRVRSDLQAVGRDSNQGKRYLAKLEEQENQIEKLRGELEELRQQVQAKQQELANFLNNLTLG